MVDHHDLDQLQKETPSIPDLVQASGLQEGRIKLEELHLDRVRFVKVELQNGAH